MLEAASAAAAAEMITADVQRDGVVHGASASAHSLTVDAVPRVFGASEEWARIEADLAQGVCALEAFVSDAFGAREAVRADVVPADLLDRCPWLEAELAALPRRGPGIGAAGADVVRDAGGELLVLEDNVRTATLMAFTVAARRLVAQALSGTLRPQHVEDALREALLGMAGDGAVVIRGRDPGNVDRWELEQRSRMTGWPLVGIGDLTDGDGRVVPREDGSRVDVVRRRTREERLRGDDGWLTAFGSVLIEPLRCGPVRVLNAFGTGVADDKRTYVYVERLVRFYCGEQPLLGSVPAWNLAIDEQPAAIDEQRAEALARLDELVVKLRDGAGREGIVLGRRSGRSCQSCAPRSTRARVGGSPRAGRTLDAPDGRRWPPRAAPRRPAAVRRRRTRAAGRESVRGARRPARRQLCAGWRRQGRVSAVG